MIMQLKQYTCCLKRKSSSIKHYENDSMKSSYHDRLVKLFRISETAYKDLDPISSSVSTRMSIQFRRHTVANRWQSNQPHARTSTSSTLKI